MTYSNPHHPLVLTVLQHVSTDRLQRAVNALVDGSLTVTLTRQTETEIRARGERLASKAAQIWIGPKS